MAKMRFIVEVDIPHTQIKDESALNIFEKTVSTMLKYGALLFLRKSLGTTNESNAIMYKSIADSFKLIRGDDFPHHEMETDIQ